VSAAPSNAKLKSGAVERRAASRRASAEAICHNLAGQRLGRKGRDTRDRIIAAAHEILAEQAGTALTLSEVARRASLRMGSLYLYFADLTELVLAMLEPVMETAETAYVGLVRERWSDNELGPRTYDFVCAYHSFWAQNSKLLHLRNSMSDRSDERMMIHRIRSAQPVMRLMVEQMDGDLSDPQAPAFSMATALMTGLERVVTVTTDATLPVVVRSPVWERREPLLRAEGRLMELGIRDYRLLAQKE
jgi:AcrR family transcriptional regulator